MRGMSKRERETRRRGDRKTGRQGDKGRRGGGMRKSLLLVSPSPPSLVSLSPCPLVSLSSMRSIHESVFDQGPDGRETVAPGDFLSFRKIAAVIRDRHLVEFVFALEDFG